MLLELERKAVVKYAKLILESGLVVGTDGDISCALYATFGTSQLADNALKGM